MRLPVSTDLRSPFRFNITPMIDVVFLLIIFFLVASYFIRSEQSRDVSLPEAIRGQPDIQSSDSRLTITIEKDGGHSIGGQRLSEAAVMNRIRSLSGANVAGKVSPEVRIRSDRGARFGEIRKLIEQCAAEKITSIRFAVVAQDDRRSNR